MAKIFGAPTKCSARYDCGFLSTRLLFPCWVLEKVQSGIKPAAGLTRGRQKCGTVDVSNRYAIPGNFLTKLNVASLHQGEIGAVAPTVHWAQALILHCDLML